MERLQRMRFRGHFIGAMTPTIGSIAGVAIPHVRLQIYPLSQFLVTR
jgi:hypothetical protein